MEAVVAALEAAMADRRRGATMARLLDATTAAVMTTAEAATAAVTTRAAAQARGALPRVISSARVLTPPSQPAQPFP